MKTVVARFPLWSVDINEVSNNVYRLMAEHVQGSRIEVTDTSPEYLMAKFEKSAETIDRQIKEKAKSLL